MTYARHIIPCLCLLLLTLGQLSAVEPQLSSASWKSPQQTTGIQTVGHLQDCPSCNLGAGAADGVRPPEIRFTLDLLILDRNNADDRAFLGDSVSGQPLIGTGDLIDQIEPGVRMGLIFLSDTSYDVEFAYLGMDRFGEPRQITAQNPITFQFFGGVPASPQQSYSVRYLSELNSAEINLRHRYASQLTLMAGLRFWELNERFNVQSDQGVFGSAIDNDLYGFQLGGELHLFQICRSVVFSTIKAGVYYNNADIQADARSGTALIDINDDEDEVAFSSDVAIGLLIPMGPQADLRLGYQGLFLDGVGLAPDQSDNYSLFTGSGSMDKTTVIYHGGFFGIDFFF